LTSKLPSISNHYIVLMPTSMNRLLNGMMSITISTHHFSELLPPGSLHGHLHPWSGLLPQPSARYARRVQRLPKRKTCGFSGDLK
jgi:hypothetical protein